MPRPVRYNLAGETNLKLVKEGPEGLEGEGYFATNLDKVVGLARKNSIWPLPFAPLVAASNLWPRWAHTTIWLVLGRKGWAFRRASATC